MADWSLLVADPVPAGNEVWGEWVRARDLSLAFDLRGPATAAWSSRGDDPGAKLGLEIIRDVLIYRDTALMFRGRIGTTGDDITEDQHTVSWSAVDYRGLLNRRILYGGLFGNKHGFNQVDQTEIGWRLIRLVQGDDPFWSTPPLDEVYEGGDMGIVDASEATGRLRDRSYEAGKSIGEAITQLSEVIDGFDWQISPHLEYQTWYPQRGSAVNWAAVWGDTVSRVRRTVDTGDYATDILALGGDSSSGSRLRASDRVVGPRGPGGRWDRSVSYSDVTEASTLVEHAEAALADASVIRPTYQVTVRPGMWTPEEAWLGDTTRIVVQSGRLETDTTGRILGIKIDVDDEGEERVTLTYGRRATTLADRLTSMDGELGALARR